MEMLTRESYIYEMSSKHKPAIRVKSGSKVIIETYDCFLNQITSETTNYSSIDWNQINPATGPVFVEEAEPGDILAVHIQKIELAEKGVMVTGPDLGVMGKRISNFSIKVVPIKDNRAIFNENIHLPLNPMIGVIGVAPKEGEVSCGTPGDHGGNMDTILIKENATVYFPVFQKGALFSLGDLHAAMGDGEVGVSGIEIPAKVTVTLSVIKGESLRTPFVENEDGIAFLVSKKTLDEAADSAVEEMVDYLLKRTDMTIEETAMLLSAAGQVQVSQIVDPLKTARCYLSKEVLKSLGIEKVF
ncbi:acetamidase/formamidase family protein [Bacillus sp. FJAT-49736]|uniref:acetamidase/formamidase family protein n=1 Tax=Bacillus sp. FJAT-49736 TaxID=2833582 RepID=UPI001BC99C0F|nr:acetamidase/formamidase family protein [Bacillus sp. FJAT-49736]MBS4174827.1 acetamidase/formamidase family protein [Bacillus sp. FJAT-49736]MBS4175516.1 acetamidase/formamidase family protein [Bacillus sp. FJAT-49736]